MVNDTENKPQEPYFVKIPLALRQLSFEEAGELEVGDCVFIFNNKKFSGFQQHFVESVERVGDELKIKLANPFRNQSTYVSSDEDMTLGVVVIDDQEYSRQKNRKINNIDNIFSSPWHDYYYHIYY
jgi:hypothetical protein